MLWQGTLFTGQSCYRCALSDGSKSWHKCSGPVAAIFARLSNQAIGTSVLKKAKSYLQSIERSYVDVRVSV